MKTIFENNGGAYMQAGDYLLPNRRLGNATQTIFEAKS